MKRTRSIALSRLLFAFFWAAFCLQSVSVSAKDANNKEPFIIGLDADLTSGSAESGLAIRRGIELAIEEINSTGGVLGRPLSLVIRDHHGNPSRGIDSILEFAKTPNLVAVVGGLHTPVAMAELPAIHDKKLIYLGPWAAGTPVVDNGYSPNFVFRVSVRDALAGGYLIDQALAQGFRKPALLLENTGWGRSNAKAMKAALAKKGMEPATVQWFNWGAKETYDQLTAMGSSGADVVILVANAPEGVAVIKTMAALPEAQRRTIISHWGITGGSFFEDAKTVLTKIDLMFLQTFSFLATASRPETKKVTIAYLKRYGSADATGIKSPTGTAHAYDLVHLLALAMEGANSSDSSQVRDAMEKITSHKGLVRSYDPPFTPTRHDALTREDFHLARYDENGIIQRIEP